MDEYTNLLLGVDGGGTKTKVLCADTKGTIFGEGLSGPTNLTVTNVGAASFNLREAIRQATERLPEGWQVSQLVMGLAGMDTQDEHQRASQVFGDVLQFFPIQNYHLVNDIVIALANGSQKGNAIAIISGTGSNCYGYNDQGQEAKVGGMDYILTDQGSGYQIGLETLQAAVKSYDGRSGQTIIEKMICEHFRIESVEHLKTKIYNPVLTKAEIAEVAKICIQAFEGSDPVAKDILDRAITELVLMIETVGRRLNILNTDLDCVLVGGMTKVEYIHNQLEEKLRVIAPQVTLIRPENEPVYGALVLARRYANS